MQKVGMSKEKNSSLTLKLHEELKKFSNHSLRREEVDPARVEKLRAKPVYNVAFVKPKARAWVSNRYGSVRDLHL